MSGAQTGRRLFGPLLLAVLVASACGTRVHDAGVGSRPAIPAGIGTGGAAASVRTEAPAGPASDALASAPPSPSLSSGASPAGNAAAG
ncbi:MAG TPA: hypothetical protein VHL53_00085, partial [Acidimicrobiia bacterium]|nr:hypothetical protein [Acidimicrobiia bacterium]